MDITFLDAESIDEQTAWIKGSKSGAAGHCVELAPVAGGIALRHSKAPQQGAFVYTPQEFSAFVQGAKDGEFDHLI